MSSSSQQASYCKNNCGFFGSPAFDGFCSKCFNQFKKANEPAPTTSSAPKPQKTQTQPSTNDDAMDIVKPIEMTSSSAVETTSSSSATSTPTESKQESATSSAASSRTASPSRGRVCAFQGCRKKIALTALVQPCRCGGHFCPNHRHDFQHNCTVDVKSVQQQQIRAANPVVAPSKLSSI